MGKKANDEAPRTLKAQMETWLKGRGLDDYVPVDFFGKDHWTTFAYAETVCVDHDGVLEPLRMRCNWRRHRPFAPTESPRSPGDGAKYPTRLKEGIELKGHDDWDCLQDLENAGLIEIVSDAFRKPFGLKGHEVSIGERASLGPFPNLTCKVAMTPLGLKVVIALRDHIAKTSRSAEFVVPADLRREIDDHYEKRDAA